MAKNDRRIDDFPYTRSNAEKLITQTQAYINGLHNYSNFLRSIEAPGNSSGVFEKIVADFVTLDVTFDIEKLITNTFPELLPIEWEITA